MSKGNYFLSTGYRRSSAALNPDAWYYEMYCWELNDKNERGDIVYQDYANYQKKAIKQHYLYIKKLLKNTKDRW